MRARDWVLVVLALAAAALAYRLGTGEWPVPAAEAGGYRWQR
jgi:hypothetical protein